MIDALTGQGSDVRHACRTLGVSESGYYAWKDRPTSPRELRRIWLAGEIVDVHKASGGTYGATRVKAELIHGRGVYVGHNAVELIMRRLGINGLATRRLPRGARLAKSTSLDLVGRQFRRAAPDELWMTDITEHPTREGKIYCCVVLDAFSRLVVGWSIDSTQTTTLFLNALGMATRRRSPDDDLVIHSDRGVQFTSWAFSQKVKDVGIAPSMGAVATAYDNAMVESFWGRMQVGAVQPKALDDPDRTGRRHPRLHRALPQHPQTPQRPRDALPNRLRNQLPQDQQRRLTPVSRLHVSRGRSQSPSNPVRLTGAISAVVPERTTPAVPTSPRCTCGGPSSWPPLRPAPLGLVLDDLGRSTAAEPPLRRAVGESKPSLRFARLLRASIEASI